MTRITAENITVDIPILSIRARSLRTIFFGKVKAIAPIRKARAIGGQIIDHGTQIPVMRALDGVSFSLKEGDRLGLIGPNGAGKTTLIRVLADVYAPTSGSLMRQGKLVPMFDIGLGFDGELTGYENIRMRGMIQGLTQREIEDRTAAIAEFSELEDYLGMPVRTYSQGMLLRLMFSIATCVDGDIVLMDEWISVGDESFKLKAQQRMLDITGKAGILVIASHEPATLLTHCNLGMRLEKGKVVAFGAIQDVLAYGTGDAPAILEPTGAA